MTLIDKIKADREAGTAGPWEACATDDLSLFVCADNETHDPLIATINTVNPADARRIANVPNMEAALLAADALGLAIDDAASVDNAGVVATALAAYRKAIGDA